MATKIWVGTDTGNEGDWSVAANWSPVNVPINGDDVYLEDSSQAVSAGFAQSAVTLATLNIAQSMTGAIGDATTHLAIGATILRIGYNNGAGSPAGSALIKINLGSVISAVEILNSGVSGDSTKAAIRILGTHASNTISVRKGSVAIANETGEVSTFLVINSNYVSSKTSDVKLFIGSGVTLGTIKISGGDIKMWCAVVTLATIEAGKLLTEGSGAIESLEVDGGEATLNSVGTIALMTVEGIADFTKSTGTRVVTALQLNPGGTLKRDPDNVTITTMTPPNKPTILSASAA